MKLVPRTPLVPEDARAGDILVPPCCRASSTATYHSDSGSFVRRGWCCETDPTDAAIAILQSGIAGVLARFTLRRLRRLTKLNRTAYCASRTSRKLTEFSAPAFQQM